MIKIIVLLLVCFVVGYQASLPEWKYYYCDDCDYQHPQTRLCNAEFIAKVTLLKYKFVHDYFDHGFDVDDSKGRRKKDKVWARILKVYKTKSNKKPKDEVKLTIFPLDGMNDYSRCPYTIFGDTSSQVFLVGGREVKKNQIDLDACNDYHEEWRRLTPAQKKLLKDGTYLENCRCNICAEWYGFDSTYNYGKEFWNHRCTKSNQTCVYDVNIDKNEKKLDNIASNFNYGGCAQTKAYCRYSNGVCQWALHKRVKIDTCKSFINNAK